MERRQEFSRNRGMTLGWRWDGVGMTGGGNAALGIVIMGVL